MPAPTRTWTHSWNNAPVSQASFLAQNSEFLFELKNVLAPFGSPGTKAGWVVEGSSDGGANGAMDGVDRWASLSNVVWNTPGSDFSWITLRSQSGYPSAGKNVWLTISCEYAAGTEYQARFHWSTAVPTGGNRNTAPTQPANSRPFNNKPVFPSTLANSKYHIHYNTDGDFFAFVSEDGKAYAAFSIASFEAINGDTGVNYPWIGVCCYDNVDPGAWEEANIRNIVQSVMFWQDGTPITTNNTYGFLEYYIGGQDYMTFVDSNGSDINTSYPDLPALLASRQTNESGVFGVVTDLGIAPTGSGIVQGSELPASPAASSRTLVGEFWFPNGDTTPSF